MTDNYSSSDEEQLAQRDAARQRAAERLLLKLQMEVSDEISVRNPLDREYVITGFGDTRRERWVFPASSKDIGYGVGKYVVPRYVAKEFTRRVMNELIGQYGQEIIEKEKKAWKGAREDWAEHQRVIEPRTDNPELIKKFFPVFEWKLARKYGMDQAAEHKPKQAPGTNVWDELMVDGETPVQAPVAAPVSTSFTEQVAE